ncbi:MAG: hypothetical protein M1457_11675 [bacterium]|nr:hypothetical protein [bacterium]
MLRKLLLFAGLLGVIGAASAFALDTGGAAKPPQDNLVRILRTSNKAQTNRYVCEAFEFKNVNPFNLINFFWAVTSREEGGIYSFVKPGEERGYIVVICPEYQLDTLRKLARDLDRPQLNSAPGSAYITYRMKYRNISDPQLLAVAAFYAGATGIVSPDVPTNSVQIYDAPQGADETAAAFEEILDKPLPQIEIGLKVLEISVNNDSAIGLDFVAWKNGPGKVLAQWQAIGAEANISRTGQAHFNTRGSGIYLDYPSAFFDFLVEKGKANVLTQTKLAAVNRAPATLTTGEDILYYAVSDNSTVATPGTDRLVDGATTPVAVGPVTFPTQGRVVSGGNLRYPWRRSDPNYPLAQFPQDSRPIQSIVKAVDTGVSFVVVPTIGEKTLNLDLNMKVIDIRGYDGAGQPLLNSRQVADSMVVTPGDEVIFGGLIRDRRVQSVDKVPVLGSLPVLGYLFGHETTLSQKSVVVAILTPRVVAGSDNLTAQDKSLIKKQLGEEVLVLPRTEFGFEQNFGATF